MKIIRPAVLLFVMVALGTPARALSDRAVDYLLKTAPRPAGMGGAFTAVPDDPIGLFWNPAAALRADRLAISGNHSLRHFPHGRKNLDQFNSDTTGILIPTEGDSVVGIGFTVPGEWGTDYSDTNGVLKSNEKLMGRERRFAYSNLHGPRQTGAGYFDSDWYRYDDYRQGIKSRKSFGTGGGFSFFYESAGGMMYGVNVRGLLARLRGENRYGDNACAVTLGAAYRHHRTSSTIAAADVELNWKHGFDTRLFGGIEKSFDRRAFVRLGSMNGLATYGFGGRFGSLRLDYAVVRDLLPEVSGEKEVRSFGDGHFLSYTLSL